MIHNCPFCGHFLDHHLVDGLAGCLHCHRTFDSSPVNLLLATAWYIRKVRCVSVDRLVAETKVPEPVAVLAISLVVEYDYSQDEFQKAVKTLGIR